MVRRPAILAGVADVRTGFQTRLFQSVSDQRTLIVGGAWSALTHLGHYDLYSSDKIQKTNSRSRKNTMRRLH